MGALPWAPQKTLQKTLPKNKKLTLLRKVVVVGLQTAFFHNFNVFFSLLSENDDNARRKAAGAIMALSVGSTAPAFSCTAHTGATISLSDYAGKKVILWFYPRAATGG